MPSVEAKWLFVYFACAKDGFMRDTWCVHEFRAISDKSCRRFPYFEMLRARLCFKDLACPKILHIVGKIIRSKFHVDILHVLKLRICTLSREFCIRGGLMRASCPKLEGSSFEWSLYDILYWNYSYFRWDSSRALFLSRESRVTFLLSRGVFLDSCCQQYIPL